MTPRRFIISAGGTGGHLFPAQALAQQLMRSVDAPEILFVAGGLNTNRYFDRTRFPFQEVICSPLLSRHPVKSLKGLIHLIKGLRQSLTIMQNFKPDVVVGFGSYYTVPILLAAKWLKIPIILHEANSIPGKANKYLASLATCVGVHFPTTAAYFKGKAVEVGLPLREGFQHSSVDKDSALNYFGLSEKKKTLLIFGGSQGAQTINRLIKDSLPLFQKLSLQVIHLTGHGGIIEDLSSLYASHQILAKVKDFEINMQFAWRVADVFLGRSGASTIAEAIEFEVPGIIVPYPYATDGHQEKNADFLVETVGAAWKLMEPGLTSSQLSQTIERFFHTKRDTTFRETLKIYKQRPYQLSFCELVLKFDQMFSTNQKL